MIGRDSRAIRTRQDARRGVRSPAIIAKRTRTWRGQITASIACARARRRRMGIAG